ncbi:MAG: DNA polymerase I [Thiohalomonadaceae bacterium]
MNEIKKKPLVLVDGSSYLYRAFHALPALSNSRGEPTGAVYGVVNMLRRLLNDYAPEHVAVVFDAKGKTFRDDLYADYKANRPPMPEDLVRQIEPLHAIVEAMGLPLIMIDGVEADDVIATLAHQAEAEDLPVLISTGDKDLAQLVNEHITLLNTMTDTSMDPAGVLDKFGVQPEQVIDYLTLIGDSSDNIPGVPMVGPKTAQKWLQKYGSLDEVIAHADEINGKVGQNLRDSLSFLPLSRELVTCRTDVALPQGPLQLQRATPDNEALREWFGQMEFKTWLSELLDGGASVAEPNETKAVYETILQQEQLTHWLDRLTAAELIAFDTETTSLDYKLAEIVGISFAIQPGEAAYVPLAHDYTGAPDQLDRTNVLAQLKPLLEDPARPKLGQNLKYDMNVLANHGIHLRGIAHDSMLQSYVLESTATRHDMDSLALKYLGHKMISFAEVAGKGVKQLSFNQVPLEQAAEYAAEDADITLQLHQALWPRLVAEPRLRQVYEEIELPLVPILAEMEQAGVLLDIAMLKRQGTELALAMKEIEQATHSAAGGPFNLSSPKQIQQLLFEHLQLPVLKKTPKGQPSTAEEVLQELSLDGYELPSLILQHRSLAKLKSTYTDRLPEQMNPRSGRVHTSYHQAVATTGRLSSSDPNLQNIPVRTAEGRRIRQAFIAPPGYKLLAADYSQIELRIMAHLSGDSGLLDAFSQGQDIHRATAAEVFGVSIEEVDNEMRRSAKAINFGLIYGMSAYGLARQLGIDRAAAQEYVELYFARYPGVQRYMDEIRTQAKEIGYVETVFGRRLYVPDIKASNAQRRQYAERTAINAPMQGTAADIIKLAMIAIAPWQQGTAGKVRMIMQVHDELVFEIAEDFIATAQQEIRQLMEGVASLKVPLKVEVGMGQNWDEAH